MIVFRYFAKEIFTALAALTTILLLIFLSNQLIRYLSLAAAGKLPGLFIMKLMMLEIPYLLGLLLPLGFYVAILIAFGRFYADNEMTAMMVGGLNQRRTITMCLGLAAVTTSIVAVLMLWLGPQISLDREKLLSGHGPTALLDTISPGRFRSFAGGNKVIFIEDITRDRTMAKGLFFAEMTNKKMHHWQIIHADEGRVVYNDKNNSRAIELKQGKQYQGAAGHSNFRITHFDKAHLELPQIKANIRKRERVIPTIKLLYKHNKTPREKSELYWRFSICLLPLILTLLAIPLSRLKPRQGKYAKLLPAILVFVVYANLLFVVRDWVANSTVSAPIGFGGLHASMVLLALILHWQPKLAWKLSYNENQ